MGTRPVPPPPFFSPLCRSPLSVFRQASLPIPVSTSPFRRFLLPPFLSFSSPHPPKQNNPLLLCCATTHGSPAPPLPPPPPAGSPCPLLAYCFPHPDMTRHERRGWPKGTGDRGRKSERKVREKGRGSKKEWRRQEKGGQKKKKRGFK